MAIATCVALLSGVAVEPAFAKTKLKSTPHPHSREAHEKIRYPVLETGWGAAFADHVKIIGLRYMTEQERESSRLVIERGVVYTSKGDLFPDYPETDLLIYVMDAAGNFYVGNQTRDAKLHHSSFFAGGPVAAAGEIKISRGRITMINRESGHYKPGRDVFDRVLDALERDGVDIEPLRSGGNRKGEEGGPAPGDKPASPRR